MTDSILGFFESLDQEAVAVLMINDRRFACVVLKQTDTSHSGVITQSRL